MPSLLASAVVLVDEKAILDTDERRGQNRTTELAISRNVSNHGGACIPVWRKNPLVLMSEFSGKG